jgi:hypothetical protein
MSKTISGFDQTNRVGRKIVGANRTARMIAECVFARLSRRREFALAPVGNASRFFMPWVLMKPY